jgi:hypothetical protein
MRHSTVRRVGVLRREFPDTKIVGLFIARCVPQAVDIGDFDI